MLDALTTMLASSGAGSIIGGLFGWLNRKEDRKDKASEREYELKRIDAQSKADVDASDARSFEESQKTLSKAGGAIKSAVRPLVTGVLMFAMFQILTGLEQITGGVESLPVEDAVELYRDVVLNIIGLTSTAVSWWFASRPSANR